MCSSPVFSFESDILTMCSILAEYFGASQGFDTFGPLPDRVRRLKYLQESYEKDRAQHKSRGFSRIRAVLPVAKGVPFLNAI